MANWQKESLCPKKVFLGWNSYYGLENCVSKHLIYGKIALKKARL